MADCESDLVEAVQFAYAVGGLLRICGGGSKAFFGAPPTGESLDVTVHRGIVSYEPTELVLTARAGTPLVEIEALLAEHGQMLACEPPHFGKRATLGGAVACGFSGPRRPFAGALRDFVLGARLINGKGEALRFGGQVMKNVAGFDVSRLMVGAQGTLGVLLEISLKVLPRPAHELTLQVSCDEENAILLCADWASKPLPISAAAWLDGVLYVRFSGARVAVETMEQRVMGEHIGEAAELWSGLREHSLPFFNLTPSENLWRLSLPPGTPPMALEGRTCVDWGGAQRWLVSSQAPAQIFAVARAAGGHATLFRAGEGVPVERTNLDSGIVALQRRIKHAFDPAGILNVGGQ